MTTTDTLLLRRLGWAGVEIRLGETRLLIDPSSTSRRLSPSSDRPGVPCRRSSRPRATTP